MRAGVCEVIAVVHPHPRQSILRRLRTYDRGGVRGGGGAERARPPDARAAPLLSSTLSSRSLKTVAQRWHARRPRHGGSASARALPAARRAASDRTAWPGRATAATGAAFTTSSRLTKFNRVQTARRPHVTINHRVHEQKRERDSSRARNPGFARNPCSRPCGLLAPHSAARAPAIRAYSCAVTLAVVNLLSHHVDFVRHHHSSPSCVKPVDPAPFRCTWPNGRPCPRRYPCTP